MADRPGSQNRFGDITIYAGALAVKIKFPNHTAAPPGYVENLQAFVNKCKEASERSRQEVPGLEGLGLESIPMTQAASEAPTPGNRPVYYRAKSVGKGGYGEVYMVTRARDGMVFAAKTFKPPPNQRKRKLGEADPEWLKVVRREFTILEKNPHPNIMQVFEFREDPEPMMILPFFHRGNITEAGVIGDSKCIATFEQLLDGLSHLHARGIVHHDIKPENILVEMKPFFKVFIGDFGLSKTIARTSWPTTFCGTLKYTAPEVFPGINNGYGPSVDIWSLGVLTAEWFVDIPQMPKTSRTWKAWIETWSSRVRSSLVRQGGGGTVARILLRMVVFDPQCRWTGEKCLQKGFTDGLFKKRAADGLVVDARDLDCLAPGEESDGAKTPARATSPQPRLQTSIDSGVTVDAGNIWPFKPPVHYLA